MKYLGIGLVHAWRWTFGLLTPAGTCKYHPSCSQYALDAFREFGFVRGGVLAALAHPPLQPVEPRRRGLREGSDGVPARRVAEGTHVIVGGLLTPLENVLTEVLTWLHESAGLTWAWSIVALTLIVRILLVPVAIRQIHSMQSLQIHAPEMKAIQQRYKADRQKQSEELMKFYKENKINPYASCLPIVLQIPIFISLFFVLRDFEKEIFPQSRRRSLEWLRPRQHHGADQGRLGTRPHRGLRREPAHLDVPHVDGDAEQGAAIHDHGPPDRLPAVHPQLSVGLDDLLAHDEPLDDGAGDHDAPADAEAGRSTETIEPHSSEGGRGVSANGEGSDDGQARPPASSGAPRRVKRKRGGRPRR